MNKQMTPFGKRTLWGGWIAFAIAAIVYLLTIEPSASLWDCGEFIATSYKLEVGHPPGTPFFFLINRLAAIVAGSPLYAAAAMNAMSALESALTIAFLFWSIAHLGRRIYRKNESELTNGQSWAIVGAAAVGALIYTFSDSFWFSAVEAEVYALSSLFTAVVFWAILKWENVADQPGSSRWLILIAYLMGLSIGAHILNLLAIPALVFIYYFKKYPGHKKADLWKPGLISIGLTGIFYMLTPTMATMGAFVDRIFVNSFGLWINSGLIFFIVLVLGLLAWGVWKTQRIGKTGWSQILLSTGLVIVGFSTYGIVLIRASVNPPMNSNNPADPYTLNSFITRDQYGASPLVFGQSYASEYTGNDFKNTYFVDEQGKYSPVERIMGYTYDPATEMLFPRMYSTQASHVEEYKRWADITGKKVRTSSGKTVTVPTFGENLKFFFGYQLNNMYWRYFLWNFVGRQSDLQNEGITDGNWMSGIQPLDELYLGPQDNLPSEVAHNKGRNTYFFLPFILGLLGFFYQLKRDGRNFLVVFLLFFMTGLAIILYLNQTPLQPRERDYAYVGSFYAFAIWAGLGVLWLYDWLHRHTFKTQPLTCALVASLLCLSVPALMGAQNWNDHDRSHRYVARDFGRNYLVGTLPNAILINYGDNDTFPIWYAQEVEGVRTDVRVMNASYITGDWYIDQMRHRSNESPPIPHSLPRSKYYGDGKGQFPIQEISRPGGGEWTAREVMNVINSDARTTQVTSADGEVYDFIPARRIALPVNKEKVLASGIVRPEDAHLIEDTIYINLTQKSWLNAGDLVFLDLLASNDWERPIYFTSAMGMLDYDIVHYGRNGEPSWSYLQQEGVLYSLVPIKSSIVRSVGRVDTRGLYDNLMNKFSYGNIKDPRVYVDQFVSTSFVSAQLRTSFVRLANALVEESDTTRAVEVLDRAMTEMPLGQLRVDDAMPYLVEAYYRAGATEKANALAMEVGGLLAEYVDYFNRFKGAKWQAVKPQAMDRLQTMYALYALVEPYQQKKVLDFLQPYFYEEAATGQQ